MHFTTGSPSPELVYNKCVQEKMRGQRRTFPVYALRYVDSIKVIYSLALARKGVFQYVRIKANLDLMWLVSVV